MKFKIYIRKILALLSSVTPGFSRGIYRQKSKGALAQSQMVWAKARCHFNSFNPRLKSGVTDNLPGKYNPLSAITNINKNKQKDALIQPNFLYVINASSFVLFTVFCILVFASCRKLQQNITLNLLAFKSQLSVECYLGNLDPSQCSLNAIVGIEAAISNTQDYFAPVNLNSLEVKGADVTISYDSAGQTYTFRLQEDQLINNCDTSNVKLFNYKYFKYSYSLDSINIGGNYVHIPNIRVKKTLHFHTGLLYTLNIDDHNGRTASATTQWLDTVHITKITNTFNSRDTTYNLLIHWNDVSTNADYYRMQARVLNMDSAAVVKRGNPLRQDVSLSDDLQNGGDVVVGGPYRFKKGDSVEVKVFHIRKEYYDYLRTVSAAVSALGNPFGQPAAIASNITGGLGIFTVLPWSKKIYVIR